MYLLQNLGKLIIMYLKHKFIFKIIIKIDRRSDIIY